MATLLAAWSVDKKAAYQSSAKVSSKDLSSTGGEILLPLHMRVAPLKPMRLLA